MRDPLPLAAIEEVVRCHATPTRFRHCVRTAMLSRKLCRRFGEDSDRGYAAGLAHDAARDLPLRELLRLAAKDGLGLEAEERANPIVAHGRAAAALVQHETGCEDPAVLTAIRDHVTGRPGMSALSRIVFCADYLEPGRNFTDPVARRRMLGLDLDAMTRAVLEAKIAWLGTPAPASHQLREELARHA